MSTRRAGLMTTGAAIGLVLIIAIHMFTRSVPPVTLTTLASTCSRRAVSPTATVTTLGQDIHDRYGSIQVTVRFRGAQILNVTTNDQPTDGHSQQIDQQSLPQLTSESLTAQSTKIDTISGASYTSNAYRQSLQAAIDEQAACLKTPTKATNSSTTSPSTSTQASKPRVPAQKPLPVQVKKHAKKHITEPVTKHSTQQQKTTSTPKTTATIPVPKTTASPTTTRKPTPVPQTTTPTPQTTTTTPVSSTVTGVSTDDPYGPFALSVTFEATKITAISVAQEPSDPHSQAINQQAIPLLTQEALQAQSAHVDTISGASYTSQSYQQALQAAIDKVHGG